MASGCPRGPIVTAMNETTPENDALPVELPGLSSAEAQSFLTQLLHLAPAPIYLTGVDGRYLFVNQAWEEAVRVPRA